MKHVLLIIAFLTVSFGLAAQSAAQRADSAYNKEDYRLAISLYIEDLATHGPDAQVYYNLGNAYYRNGNMGRAVLSYERSLRLDPTDADARHNLEFVRSRIQDRPEDDTSFLATLHHNILGSMTANAWAWTALVLFVLFLGAAALYIFSSGVMLRKAGFFGGIILLFVFGYALYVALDSAAIARSHNYAVVTAPSTMLSSSPRPSRTSTDRVVSIHEGTTVEIVDSVATPDDPVSPMWYNVKVNNATRAWLRASDVERI